LQLRRHAPIEGGEDLLLRGRPLVRISEEDIDNVLWLALQLPNAHGLFPFCLRGIQLGRLLFQALARLCDERIQTRELRGLFLCRQWGLLLSADRNLLDVGEERSQAIEFLGEKRIELVIMALATSKGRSH